MVYALFCIAPSTCLILVVVLYEWSFCFVEFYCWTGMFTMVMEASICLSQIPEFSMYQYIAMTMAAFSQVQQMPTTVLQELAKGRDTMSIFLGIRQDGYISVIVLSFLILLRITVQLAHHQQTDSTCMDNRNVLLNTACHSCLIFQCEQFHFSLYSLSHKTLVHMNIQTNALYCNIKVFIIKTLEF